MGCRTPNPGKGKRAVGAKAPLERAGTPVQELQKLTFRAGQDRVTGIFKPMEGENIRFSQGKNVADQIYPTLFSVAMRAGWDPEVALERLDQAKKRPAASYSLH